MPRTAAPAFALLATALLATAGTLPAQAPVTDQLDAYWAAVSRAVAEGDYGAYAATFHPDAVLVSLTGERSYPIARALEAWKPGFDETRAGDAVASVEFRFTRRLHDDTTAHEAGMFRYSLQSAGGEPEVATLHFEALLVRQDDGWKALMEFQKERATAEEWDAAG